MKRTILTTLAATALLAIPACKGGASAAGGKLIPEQATIMAGIDVGGLLKSKLYADNKAIAESQAGYKEVVEAAKGCNLDPEKAITSVLIGTDAKDGVAVVITGTGIGDEKNLTCIADKAKEKNNGKVPFTIADEGGKKTIKMDDGTGYIVDAGTVVIASKPWAAAVKDLVDGKGKAAVDGAHKDLFTRADQSRHIWFAGVAPEQLAGMAKAQGEVDVKDFSGSIDLSDGLGVKLAAGLGSADQASGLKKKADEALPMAKMGLAMVGLPATVADTVKIDAKDALLSFEISLSASDLKTLQEKAGGLGGLMGGGGGGMGAPPAEPAAPPTPAEPPAAAPPADGAPAEAPAH
ncbi:hypothetical protein [Nannocystis sp. SCPEA4]|uniref:hypothetical protein n=1 Tax=Nannocystis sp. SCPEA4 TaxID=2996787 RepID=UPI00226D92D7|nr:hypothetical protein [Nannocystis sp. SCPEA4]MCY1055957.1 hypothetical protein [Nannocystis sp. SCPEA4]